MSSVLVGQSVTTNWSRIMDIVADFSAESYPEKDSDVITKMLVSSEWLLLFAESNRDKFIKLFDNLQLIQNPEVFSPAFIRSEELTDKEILDNTVEWYSQHLRSRYQEQMAMIIMAEIMAINNTEATMQAMTKMAEESLQCACAFAAYALIKKHGAPEDCAEMKEARDIVSLQNAGFVILGMGKLGGKELNLSSDIDLIFGFDREGMTIADVGQRSISHSQFYTKLAQMLIRLLDEVTAYGRVFRVDARLRPHGDSGPLAMSFSAMENYYQLHGREWERYAWIKARSVAGDEAKAAVLLKRLKPFVYRKYVDYRIVGSIKKMRDMIYTELKQQGVAQNIKLGHGGIRMIEFIVQTYQLLYAGRYRALINSSLQPALEELVAMSMIEEQEKEKIYQAYLFLRQLEHRIQMFKCQQTHDLPSKDLGLNRLAWSLGYKDKAAFIAAVESTRNYVQTIFDKLTNVDEGVSYSSMQPQGALSNEQGIHDDALTSSESAIRSEQQEKILLYRLIWQKLNADDSIELLVNKEIATFLTAEVIQDLLSYIHSKSYGSISADGKDILQSLIPKLMHYCSMRTEANVSMRRSLRVIKSIGQRVLYLELLNSNSTVCNNFVDYVSASQWVCDWLCNYPIVLEMLLEKKELNFSDTLDAYSKALEIRLKGNADIELIMEVLRQFHHGQVLRVALHDIQKVAPMLSTKNYQSDALSKVYEVRKQLSELAQTIIATALRVACDQLKSRFDVDYDVIKSSFAIIAYGKLGTEELSYDSDLDLVFVFDENCNLAEQGVDSNYYFIRLAKKLISILSVPTSSGVLYEIDSRLRPSGNSGLLVTSLAKFKKYQESEAWVWEHQALQKSRIIFGARVFSAQFDTIRADILSAKRDTSALQKEVSNMREKMRISAKAEKVNASFNYKHMDGGLVDIEFYCQYMVLKNANQYPQLTKVRKVKDVLSALHENGLLARYDSQILSQHYAFLLFLENYEKLFVNRKQPNQTTKTLNSGSPHLLLEDDNDYINETNYVALALAHFEEDRQYVVTFCRQHFLTY